MLSDGVGEVGEGAEADLTTRLGIPMVPQRCGDEKWRVFYMRADNVVTGKRRTQVAILLYQSVYSV